MERLPSPGTLWMDLDELNGSIGRPTLFAIQYQALYAAALGGAESPVMAATYPLISVCAAFCVLSCMIVPYPCQVEGPNHKVFSGSSTYRRLPQRLWIEEPTPRVRQLSETMVIWFRGQRPSVCKSLPARLVGRLPNRPTDPALAIVEGVRQTRNAPHGSPEFKALVSQHVVVSRPAGSDLLVLSHVGAIGNGQTTTHPLLRG